MPAGVSHVLPDSKAGERMHGDAPAQRAVLVKLLIGAALGLAFMWMEARAIEGAALAYGQALGVLCDRGAGITIDCRGTAMLAAADASTDLMALALLVAMAAAFYLTCRERPYFPAGALVLALLTGAASIDALSSGWAVLSHSSPAAQGPGINLILQMGAVLCWSTPPAAALAMAAGPPAKARDNALRILIALGVSSAVRWVSVLALVLTARQLGPVLGAALVPVLLILPAMSTLALVVAAPHVWRKPCSAASP